jgi:hypothetical protein
MARRIAWELYDPITDETYYMPVNPYEDGGSHAINRTVNYAARSGMYLNDAGVDCISTILSYSQRNFETFNYVGKTYNELEHGTLEDWVNKDYPIYLTDDLGRIWLVMLESFVIRRLPTMKNKPFKHEYTLTGFVLQEAQEATI